MKTDLIHEFLQNTMENSKGNQQVDFIPLTGLCLMNTPLSPERDAMSHQLVELITLLGVDEGQVNEPPKAILQPVRLWSWSAELAAGPIFFVPVSEDEESSNSYAIMVVMVGNPVPLETIKEPLPPSFKVETHSAKFTLKYMVKTP